MPADSGASSSDQDLDVTTASESRLRYAEAGGVEFQCCGACGGVEDGQPVGRWLSSDWFSRRVWDSIERHNGVDAADVTTPWLCVDCMKAAVLADQAGA